MSWLISTTNKCFKTHYDRMSKGTKSLDRTSNSNKQRSCARTALKVTITKRTSLTVAILLKLIDLILLSQHLEEEWILDKLVKLIHNRFKKRAKIELLINHSRYSQVLDYKILNRIKMLIHAQLRRYKT